MLVCGSFIIPRVRHRLFFIVLVHLTIIPTHYDKDKPTYKLEYCGGDDNEVLVGYKTALIGNGDFRNEECLALLKESDIVVTNPPFSLFREFIGTLIEYS